MRQSSLIRAAQQAVLAVLAVGFMSGCDKSNPIDPSPGNAPGSTQLLGFQDEALPFFNMRDPGTPDDTIDDRIVSTETFTFGGDTTAAILQAIDRSNANLVRPYRREGTGPYRRVLDYDVPASDRQIGRNTDLFVLRDAEGVVGTSEYFATALLNGIETTASPTTNSIKPWGRTQTSLVLSVGDLQRDSVLSLSFTPDPRAAAYILEIADFDDITIERELGFAAATPMPVALPHQFSQWGFVLPGQESSIRIPFNNVPFIKGQFPITLLCRVIALDATGHVIGRADTDFIKRATGRDDAGNNLYELDPLGGWVITLDPYPRGYGRPQAIGTRAAAGVLTGDQVRNMVGSQITAGQSSTTVAAQRSSIERAALARTGNPLPTATIGFGQTAPKGTFNPARQ
ncbi:MAG: hypothetical protein K8R56_07035 [Candidatus Eisenbacteria bacterium]|nr:hypothetical protein [Candidatus Eisenbacteria bacterium]